MLQPRTYPEMLGKALVLEADPFIAMVDDDEPWAEGLFMVVVVGLTVGLARLIGGWLTAAALPPLDATIEALINGWQQLNAQLGLGIDPAAADAAIRSVVDLAAGYNGMGGGWTSLFVLVATPTGFVLQWLFYALIAHLVARLMGGTGTFSQTLGALALVMAPQGLRILTAIPFVSVSGLLLIVWSMLISYRALEVAHELPWRRAAWTAVIPPVVVTVLIAGVVVLTGIVLALGGGA